MIYQDRVYGEIEIKEPVILDLIKSPSLERLKGIDQAGYLPLEAKLLGVPYSKVKHNRFEHSLGVFILLKKFRAPLEEQIAGLIHDVSHPVFSHCIDYALDEGSEKYHVYQDDIHDEFVINSELPKILGGYGFDINHILNMDNFPLLERELPDLCADRLDYSLRTAAIFNEATSGTISYLLSNLTIENNFWVFKNLNSAEKYAKLFLKLNKIYYSGFPSGVMFRAVGDTIRYALSKDYVKLFTTDREAIETIKEKSKTDNKLKNLFKRMEGKVKFENDPQNYDGHVFCKSRIVDPLLKIEDKTKRFSEVEESWKEVMETESKPKEYFIKFTEKTEIRKQ